jgi:8-oxo-dGTP pyrophosphatase MutT (NUDIX family)
VHAGQDVPSHWLPLVLEGARCGWLAPQTAQRLAQPPSPFTPDRGRLALDPGQPQTASQALAFAAQRLYEDGTMREWRSEQLDVCTEDGRRIATVERGACRPLGIRTGSVQLNALLPDASMIAARRAPHKLSDPNRWDNLAGGMVAAGEDDRRALEREAYEEAGLQLGSRPVARGSRFCVQRLVAEGLMIETVQVFDVRLEAGFVPVNRDGEVAAFEVLSTEAALNAIERGDFTLQASMAILDSLRRAR